jgi:hypothetical protein
MNEAFFAGMVAIALKWRESRHDLLRFLACYVTGLCTWAAVGANQHNQTPAKLALAALGILAGCLAGVLKDWRVADNAKRRRTGDAEEERTN